MQNLSMERGNIEVVWEKCRRKMEDNATWQENSVKILGEDGLLEESLELEIRFLTS